MKQHEADKPYDPGKDPYFLEAEYIIPAGIFDGGRAITFAVLAAGLLSFKLAGWLGLAVAAALGAVLMFGWRMLRRSRIAPAAEAGYINKYGMKTCECIMPREKNFEQKFYCMECGVCGKSTNVQATRLRTAKCPHCSKGNKK